MTSARLLCCDWGTSSFRLYLVNRADRTVLATIEGSDGIKRVDEAWRASDEPDRTTYFRRFLARNVGKLGEKTTLDLAGLPLILSGMASSSIGMKELPYGEVPLSLSHPEIPSTTLPADDDCPWEIQLISGVATRQDVMRGEEIQLLGMVPVLPNRNLVLLLPGTHSKHLYLQNGSMTGFKTWMTGELFDVILNETILASSLGPFEEGEESPSFLEGVRDSESGEWLHTLFTIRARVALQRDSERTVSRSYLSGLLIGYELRGLPDPSEVGVIVSGAPRLEPLYRSALRMLGYEEVQITAPEPLTVHGQLHWYERHSTSSQ